MRQHNLVYVGRESVFSAGISVPESGSTSKEVRKRFSKLARALDKANQQMMEWKRILRKQEKGSQVLPSRSTAITFLTILGELRRNTGGKKNWKKNLRREIWNFIYSVVFFKCFRAGR